MPDPLELLSDGVPVTLVIDLWLIGVLDSQAIYAAEPADTSWLPHVA